VYSALPKNERSFTVSIEGDTTAMKYEGTFITRCAMSIGDKHRKELEKTRLLADYVNPTPGLQGISEILSTLRVKLIKWPEWWNELNQGLSSLDENVVVEIYEKIQDIESVWRAELRDTAQTAKNAAVKPGDESGNP